MGMKAGSAISTFITQDNFVPYFNNSFKPGIYLGLNSSFKLNSKNNFKLELLYVNKGKDDNPDDYLLVGKLSLDYLSVPLLIEHKLFKNLFLQAGSEIAVLMNSRILYNAEWLNTNRFFQTFDVGIVIGLAYQFKNRLFLDFRAIEGISRIQNGLYGYLPDFDTPHGRNRTIAFGIGYQFLK